jgi:hypothetical protein
VKKLSIVWKLTLYTLIAGALCIELFSEGSFRLVYFTIQSNLFAALCLFLFIVMPERRRFKGILRGISLIAILTTGIVFNFVLNKAGFGWGTATVTHVAAPIGYVLDWILFDAHGYMKWKDIFLWLLYPLIYCALSVYTGIVSGFSVYYFLDVSMGYAALSRWILALLGMAIVVCFFIAGTDKALARATKARRDFS